MLTVMKGLVQSGALRSDCESRSRDASIRLRCIESSGAGAHSPWDSLNGQKRVTGAGPVVPATPSAPPPGPAAPPPAHSAHRSGQCSAARDPFDCRDIIDSDEILSFSCWICPRDDSHTIQQPKLQTQGIFNNYA